MVYGKRSKIDAYDGGDSLDGNFVAEYGRRPVESSEVPSTFIFQSVRGPGPPAVTFADATGPVDRTEPSAVTDRKFRTFSYSDTNRERYTKIPAVRVGLPGDPTVRSKSRGITRSVRTNITVGRFTAFCRAVDGEIRAN